MGSDREPASREKLQARWHALCARLALRDVPMIFSHLWSQYTATDRHYHGIHHIGSSLAMLDEVRDRCENPGAVELALWFHDCVYDGRRLDNEERSAEIAREALASMGAGEALIAQVVDLILATRHIVPPATNDQRWLVDIDLAPLGASPEVFDANGESIRREYAHLDDAAYSQGRREILRRFLDRPQIYWTQAFADRYEAQARANLARSVDDQASGAKISSSF